MTYGRSLWTLVSLFLFSELLNIRHYLNLFFFSLSDVLEIIKRKLLYKKIVSKSLVDLVCLYIISCFVRIERVLSTQADLFIEG